MNLVFPETDVNAPWWVAFRRQMPVTKGWVYFDHAAVSPLPEVTRQSILRWANQACESGEVHWPEWAEGLEELRRRAAALIGAQLKEIALIRNTSHGISIVAEAFPWKEGDNVVIPADEFPANQYPWMALQHRGVEVRRVPPRQGRVHLEDLRAACDRRTRILSASWVSYHLGWRHDPAKLADIAHACGALLFLDAIQGLGVFPLEVAATGVDFLAADGHKWLLGPEGAGIFYIREPLWDLLRPTSIGWNSVINPFDFDHIDFSLKASASRYEAGSQNMVGFLGLLASLALLQSFPADQIAQRVLSLTGDIVEKLRSLGARIASDRSCEAHSSGIVAVELPGQDIPKVRRELLKKGIVTSARAGRLRLSPHAYNDQSDIERLVEALRLLLRNS